MLLLGLLSSFGVAWDESTIQDQTGLLFFSPNMRVSGDGVGRQIEPDLAIDSTGRIYVVWTDSREGTDDIYISTSDDNGESFSPARRVDDAKSSATVQTMPSVAVGRSGEVYVAWIDGRSGQFRLRFSRSSDGGLSFAPSIEVSPGGDAIQQLYPDIASDSEGRVFIVWSEARDLQNGPIHVKVSASSDGGSTFSQAISVAEDAGLNVIQANPTIAYDGSGTVHVVWEQNTDEGFAVYAATSSNHGVSFSAPVRVDDGVPRGTRQQLPDLAVLRDGTETVVWADDRAGNFDIRLAVRQPGASSFAPSVTISTGGGAGNELWPSVSTDPDGRAIVVWRDGRYPTESIFASLLGDGEPFTEENSRVDDSAVEGSNRGHPRAALAQGKAHVVWEDSRSGKFEIFYAQASVSLTAPACSILSPSTGDTISGVVQISGTAIAADPNRPILRVEIRIDEGEWVQAEGTAAWTFEWHSTSVADGLHTVWVRAFDGVAYCSISSVTVSVANHAGSVEPPGGFDLMIAALVISGVVAAGSFILGFQTYRRRRSESPRREHQRVVRSRRSHRRK